MSVHTWHICRMLKAIIGMTTKEALIGFYKFKQLTILALVSLINLSAAYTQVVSISGQVLRHNAEPLPGVTVTCSSGDAVITDENGSFEFSDLIPGTDYHIDGFFEASIFEEISVLDACYNRFIINLIYNALNSQLIANDYNQDGTYQGLDFIRIANTSVRIENYLNELDAPWRFFDGHIDNVSINTNDLEPGINLVNLSSDTSDLVLIAVKSGDVAIDADHQPPPAYGPSPIFYIPDMAIEQNEEVLLSIKVRDLEQIMGFQHGLVWDTSYLEFMAYENKTDIFDLVPNEEHVEEGLFPLMEIDFSLFGSQTIADDSTIYQVRFKALQEANSLVGILDFDSLFIQKQVVYIDTSFMMYLIEAEYVIEDNESTGINRNFNHLITFDISPNPAVEGLRFSIQLLKSETSTLSLLDTNGRLLRKQTFNSQKITGEMPIENLQKGVYYLQLQTKEGLSSRSFVKQ